MHRCENCSGLHTSMIALCCRRLVRALAVGSKATNMLAGGGGDTHSFQKDVSNNFVWELCLGNVLSDTLSGKPFFGDSFFWKLFPTTKIENVAKQAFPNKFANKNLPFKT